MPASPQLSASDWISECRLLPSLHGPRVAYRDAGTGDVVLLLHGFPTWSYDFVDVAADLASTCRVVSLDFPGYGASDKPARHRYTVEESADAVEDLLGELGVPRVHLVAHDYGGIVAQELLDRRRRDVLSVDIASVTLLNSGIVYSHYHPTRTQRLLAMPVIGSVVSARIDRDAVHTGLDAVRGNRKLGETEFNELWHGISLQRGHRLAHRLIRYNAERVIHHQRWEAALSEWDGPLHLIWGTADPVSGRHVLEAALERLPAAKVTRLDGVGHFPQSESPAEVTAGIQETVSGR